MTSVVKNKMAKAATTAMRGACDQSLSLSFGSTDPAFFASRDKGLFVLEGDKIIFGEIASAAPIPIDIGHAAGTYPPCIVKCYRMAVFGRVFVKFFQ